MRRTTTALIAAPLVLLALACGSGTGTAGHKIDKGTTHATGTAPKTGATGAAGTTAASSTMDKAQKFSGSSDKLIKLKGLSSDRLHVATMTYKGSANFIVTALDSDGQESDLLVDEIGHYTGNVAIDLGGLSDDAPAALKVEAKGAWTLTIVDMATMPSMKSGTTTGTGPAVLLVPKGILSGLSAFTFTHKGHANFIVNAYGDSSGGSLLIDEIGKFSGEEVIPSDARVITIQADGAWTIKASK